MNTEMRDYLSTLSRRKFFLVSLLTTFLGIAIIVLGGAILVIGQSDILYGIMFLCGCIMMIMNGYKARQTGNKAVWIFYAAAAILGLLAVGCAISFQH